MFGIIFRRASQMSLAFFCIYVFTAGLNGPDVYKTTRRVLMRLNPTQPMFVCSGRWEAVGLDCVWYRRSLGVPDELLSLAFILDHIGPHKDEVFGYTFTFSAN